MKQFLKEKLNGRTQRWLCEKTGIGEVDFSNSLNGKHRQFRKFEWDKIVEALGISDEDLQSPAVQNYPFSLKEPIQ